MKDLGYDDWNQGVTTTWAEAFYACADIVADAPTIEPEREKGKWIKKKGSLWTLATCSVCGELSVEGDKPFCPNCGADMRGEEE